MANFEVGKLDSFVMAFDSKARIDTLPGVRYMSIPNGAIEAINLLPQHYVGMGEADFEERRPGMFTCLHDNTCPWVSPNPDINSPEWERARKVREALLITVDRQEVVDTLLGGEGMPHALFLWENQLDRLDADLRQWEFNPERARQLLADAGYEDGFEITISTSIREVPAEQEACEALADYWKDIGLRPNINRLPYVAFGPTLTGRQFVGANCHGTSGRPFPAPIMSVLIGSDSGFGGGPDHPILDDFLDQIAASTLANHYDIMNKLARFMYENALNSAYYSVNVLWPLSPKVDSWRENLQGSDARALGSYEFAKHRDK